VGGDSCLSTGSTAAETLSELTATEYLRTSGAAVFNQPCLPMGTKTQALAALLCHRLHAGFCGQLEAETLTLELRQCRLELLEPYCR